MKGNPVAEALSAMPDSHLLCRDFGHGWRPWSAEWIPQRRQYAEHLVCTRCQTVRTRLLDEWGAQLGQGYTYPEGYLVKGLGRLTGDDRNAVRLAGLRAVMNTTTGEAPSSQSVTDNGRASA